MPLSGDDAIAIMRIADVLQTAGMFKWQDVEMVIKAYPQARRQHVGGYGSTLALDGGQVSCGCGAT